MRNYLRFSLGSILQGWGATEFIRLLYIWLVRRYLIRFGMNEIKGAWIRRSIVTPDFMPLMSDADCTILSSENEIFKKIDLEFHRPGLFLKDIQLLSERFFEPWLETGGFRNRQFPQWNALKPNSPILNVTHHFEKEILAFELAYESHLLFKQIGPKLKTALFNPDEANDYALTKLTKELYRIKLYWEEPRSNWATCIRDQIPLVDNLDQFLFKIEVFWKDLLNHLNPKLRHYQWSESIIFETELGFFLNIEIEGLKVFLVHSIENLKAAILKHPECFVTTITYFELVKGVGIHEQTQVNELAVTNPKGYYFKFNCQRLAHDLIGSLYLEPDNEIQLYYCFSNIQDFYKSLTKKTIPQWDYVHESWQTNGKMPLLRPQILELSRAYLDLLASLL